MRKVIYLLLCAAIMFLTGCSESETQSGAVQKNELGLIVPKNSASENLILLENGKLTNPVSGIDDFDSLSLGDKILINYRELGVENGVTNIEVTQFAEANDSTFTPETDPIDVEYLVYGADFSGRYYISNEDSTVTYTGQISLSFGSKQSGNSDYSYTLTSTSGVVLSGKGEFEITDGHLIFSNNDDEDVIVPLGEFTAAAGSGSLYLWPTEFNGLYITYALTVDE